MKCKLLLIVLFVADATFAYTQTSGFISTKNKEIIGADGKPFLIKGTNLGNWLVPEGYMFKFKNASSPRLINQAITELVGPAVAKSFWKKFQDVYITKEDIHYLKSIGVNSVRVPFNYRLFTNESYLGDNDSARGFKLLDRLINWCKAEGLYVLLDMHCAPGGQTGDNIDDGYGYPFLFESAESREQTANIWKRIADRYKNETAVLGYDLLNEPIAHYFDTGKLNPLLEPVYKQIAKAIREKDKNHILFLGGAQWDSDFKIFGAPFDDKLVYTFHKYWTAATKDVIQQYIDFRDKYNVPIYCGETGENTNEWIKEFREILEANNIGWHFWTYKKLDNTKGFVSFKIPENYEAVIAYADTTRSSFANVRKNRPADIDKIQQALNDFLVNCRFSNCTKNEDYIKALNFKAD